jgi:DNA-binding response OmpR family regulator
MIRGREADVTRRPGQQTVLLVDDDPRSIKLMQIVLGHAGYHVLAATDAQAGLETLDRERPDLVMVDLLMPGTDGIGFCRQVRQRPGNDALPLVLFTAMAAADTRQQALQAGADDVLVKPFDRGELLGRLEQLLARNGHDTPGQGTDRR